MRELIHDAGRISASVFLACIAAIGSAWAVPPPPPDDEILVPDEAIDLTDADAILPTGADALGDSVDLYDGALSFRQTDVSIPGNSGLSVALTRYFRAAAYGSTRPMPAKAFGTWDIAVPRITTELASVSHWAANRCTGEFEPPPVKVSNLATSWVSEELYWNGYQLELPDSGSSVMLMPVVTTFPHPASFTRVARGAIGFECTSAHDPSGNAAGEGFVVRTPNGHTYIFNLLTEGPATTVKPSNNITHRYTAIMLATSVTDRFGNSVQYQYDASARLTGIVASDGRSISIGWALLATGEAVINSVTAGPRLWIYQYSTANGKAELTAVVRPDGTQWQLSLWNLYDFHPGSVQTPGPVTGTVTSPYGLTGSFQLNTLVVGHGAYPNILPPSPPENIPQYYTGALIQKTLAGPNLPAATWTYLYNKPSGWTIAVGGSATCWTQVTLPSQNKMRHTFSMLYDWSEGIRLKTEYFADGGTLLRQIDYGYEAGPAWGTLPHRFRNNQQDAGMARLVSTTLTQNGDTYRSQNLAFDAFSNPTQVHRWNSFSTNDVTETRTYLNSQSPWVIGSESSVAANGLSASSRSFTSLAQPQDRYAFGLRTSTTSYCANGLPYQVFDGLNRVTTYSDYHRGVARRRDFPGGSFRTLTVNDFGEITGTTDERGNTTTYGRDALGRVSSVAYPAGDVVSWAGQAVTYASVSELGLSAGTFRQRITRGRLQRSTYYDASLRPILVQELDTATGIAIYTRTAYDYANRVTFQSYPSSSSAASAGITTTYDDLGRVTGSRTTDGIVLSRLTYLSGNRIQASDADGKVTTTTYQAFDTPDYTNAIRAEAPENRTTVVARDVFGKITGVTQSGSWSGGSASATRTFEYDGNQRLCRRTDPERASTAWGYDAASQIVWEAKGLSGIGCLAAAPSGATIYDYDASGRRSLDDYPGTTDDVGYGYDAADNITSVTTSVANWTYSYNKRNLLESEQASIDSKIMLLDPSYNSEGQVASLTTPARTISYSPDAWGRPTQLGSYVSSIQYHPNGLASSYSLGNGLTYGQSLDNRLRPQMQDTRDGGTSIQKFVYGYSLAGDLLSLDDQVDNADDLSATYDDLHRLKTANGLWGNYVYSYDTLNNLRGRGGTGALTYTYDAATNRLTGVSGSQSRTYGYNAQGAATGDGIRSFTLNGRGQIQSIVGAAIYGYDGNAKRIKIDKSGSVEYTLYDLSGRMVYSERAAKQTDYLSLNGQQVVELRQVSGATTPTYLHPDLLGSPRLATDAAKAVAWREHFDPFGQKLNGVADKIGYTGHAHDQESGYTYMQARYYDAQVGRFLSTDPVDDDFSLYAYVSNNPLNRTDPTGMRCTGVGDESKCKIDLVNSESIGKVKLTQQQQRKIVRLESSLTRAYMKAQQLGSRIITVKGDSKFGIGDKKISGDQIVDNLQEASLEMAEVSPRIAGGVISAAHFDPSYNRIRFFNGTIDQPLTPSGNYQQSVTAIHEALHMSPLLSQWESAKLKIAHQKPFDDAAEDLMGPLEE